MNWEEYISIDGATVWISETPKRWAVTADRDGRGVVPRNDCNHQLTKKAALENWKAKLATNAA